MSDEKAENVFDVALYKGNPPQSLGFNFKKPFEGASTKGFLVVAVIPGGVLGRYNAEQAVAGRWDRIVLPGMRVRGVNGVENNFGGMLQQLKDKEAITLTVESNRKMPRAQPSVLPIDSQRRLQERVTALLGQNRENLRIAAASNEQWKATSEAFSNDLVREVCSLLPSTQQLRPNEQPQLPEFTRPSTSPSPTRIQSSNYSMAMEPEANSDDEVMSEESV